MYRITALTARCLIFQKITLIHHTSRPYTASVERVQKYKFIPFIFSADTCSCQKSFTRNSHYKDNDVRYGINGKQERSSNQVVFYYLLFAHYSESQKQNKYTKYAGILLFISKMYPLLMYLQTHDEQGYVHEATGLYRKLGNCSFLSNFHEFSVVD